MRVSSAIHVDLYYMRFHTASRFVHILWHSMLNKFAMKRKHTESKEMSLAPHTYISRPDKSNANVSNPSETCMQSTTLIRDEICYRQNANKANNLSDKTTAKSHEKKTH